MLEALSQAALRMALAIERQAAEAPAEGSAPAAPGEAAMAFSRVSRAMRMSALLQSRLIADLQALAQSPARLAALAEAAQRGDPAYRHKARVEGVVERVAKATCGDDEDRLERLMVEAGERLDDDDIYGEVLTRPVGELVALICRDLGLDPDWTRLAQEAWAKEEIAGGDPRSPFIPLPLDGGEVGSEGDLSAAPQLNSHPHPQPSDAFVYEREDPHRGGRETGIPPPPPSNSSDVPTSSLIFDDC